MMPSSRVEKFSTRMVVDEGGYAPYKRFVSRGWGKIQMTTAASNDRRFASRAERVIAQPDEGGAAAEAAIDHSFLDPNARISDFAFGEETAAVFDDMLSRSVPFYD